MAAKTTLKQETNKRFYHLLIMQFKQVFSFAKIENLPSWIKTVKNVSNYQIFTGNLLSEVHIDAWTNLEALNGGNDFGICQWRLINMFSALNKVKIYSEGSKGNKIGDEIIWLLVISCYTRSIWSNILLPKLQRKKCWWKVSMMLFKYVFCLANKKSSATDQKFM